MKAIIITRPGGPEVLEIQDRPKPEPGVGQIRVRVRASALNRADLMQREGNYPVPPGVPADISGMEYVGEVDALGPAATLWKAGDRVMGIIGGAGHAEFLCVHEREAMPVPGSMSWDEAAAIPEAFLTAHDALFNRLELRSGETLLIHAVGSGVGTAALQIARVAGARVIGTARSADKLERAKKLGLDVAIDASRGDWAAQVEAAIGKERVHAVMDLVGGNYLDGNMRVLAVRGRIVVVGLTAGATTPFNMGTLLRKRLTIVGTVLRARSLEEKISLARDFAERGVPLFETGKLRPVVDRVLSFSEVRAAHELMASNKTFGKVVLRWD
ncbi:MAG TPA: NAD(P)H-quinone oxidoreductase [Gemmatimonadaceae bacterium]|nr:NAD(P)H-quinone oxidoreductase [Gemmatimonadaceae bacterium]